MASKTKLIEKRKAKSEIQRKEREKTYKYTLLVVCEDENTEKKYFEQFAGFFTGKEFGVISVGTGTAHVGVVNRAIEEANRRNLHIESNRNSSSDFVWVVFDRDRSDKEEEDKSKKINFDEALVRAQKHNFKVAYSNDAFELWLLLHLEDVIPDIPIPRNDKQAFTITRHDTNLETLIQKGFYDGNITDSNPTLCIYERLEKAIRKHPNYSDYIYIHNNEYIPNDGSDNKKIIKKQIRSQKTIIEVIHDIGDELKAMERADILVKAHNGIPESSANPSTKVYCLVQEIRDWINFYKQESRAHMGK
ncbi:MAG: RloB family protein [Pseudanabaenaceae cyanobacterium bins.39]|nr:RloB family protein [Pseudanabaenaceae cyanobacterium bins.39]